MKKYKYMSKEKQMSLKIEELSELRECIDKCCKDLPIVQFNDTRSGFRIICKWCYNEVLNNNSTKAMIEWNKMIRKIK